MTQAAERMTKKHLVYENERLHREVYELRRALDARDAEVASLRQTLQEAHSTKEDNQRAMQKRIAESLRENDMLYRTLVETSPSAILLTNLDGTILFANPQAAYLCGYTHQNDLHGIQGADLIAHDEHSMLHPLEYVQQIVQSGCLKNVEYTVRRNDGTTFPAEVSSSVVVDDQGYSVALIVVIHDVSQRKESEQKLRATYEEMALMTHDLRQKQNLLDAIFNSLEDGLLVLDGNGYVQAVNNAFANLLCASPPDIVEQRWQNLYPQIAPRFPGNLLLNHSPHETSRHEQIRYQDTQGKTHILTIQTTTLHGTHQAIEQIVVHVVDVTDYVTLQTRLMESDRFATSGKLAASVAHEINSPLQSLQLFLELARVATDAKRDEFLLHVRDEIQRVCRIVHQLLDLYRPSAAKLGSIEINTLIERLLLLHGKRLLEQKIGVDLSLQEDIPVVWGRADELMQVFLNLIVNAIDAMPDGGTLTIETMCGNSQPTEPGVSIAPRMLQCTNTNNCVVIRISDTGCGIPLELQNHIFEPFVTTRDHGTGLGLAISTQIIQHINGSLAVCSEPGKGSTFTVTIPFSSDGACATEMSV